MFDEAFDEGRFEAALELFGRDLLDGFFVSVAPECSGTRSSRAANGVPAVARAVSPLMGASPIEKTFCGRQSARTHRRDLLLRLAQTARRLGRGRSTGHRLPPHHRPGLRLPFPTARMADATIDDVDRALYEDRLLIRMLAMRRTMFVVPREDAAIVIRPLHKSCIMLRELQWEALDATAWTAKGA